MLKKPEPEKKDDKPKPKEKKDDKPKKKDKIGFDLSNRTPFRDGHAPKNKLRIDENRFAEGLFACGRYSNLVGACAVLCRFCLSGENDRFHELLTKSVADGGAQRRGGRGDAAGAVTAKLHWRTLMGYFGYLERQGLLPDTPLKIADHLTKANLKAGT